LLCHTIIDFSKTIIMFRFTILFLVVAIIFSATISVSGKHQKVQDSEKLNKVLASIVGKLNRKQKVGSFISCDACQLIVGWAESQVSNNSTESQVENFLDNDLCALIPSIVRAECENIVNAYFPELVQILLTRENPTTACDQLTLC